MMRIILCFFASPTAITANVTTIANNTAERFISIEQLRTELKELKVN